MVCAFISKDVFTQTHTRTHIHAHTHGIPPHQHIHAHARTHGTHPLRVLPLAEEHLEVSVELDSVVWGDARRPQVRTLVHPERDEGLPLPGRQAAVYGGKKLIEKRVRKHRRKAKEFYPTPTTLKGQTGRRHDIEGECASTCLIVRLDNPPPPLHWKTTSPFGNFARNFKWLLKVGF